jgi:hypothetical protein
VVSGNMQGIKATWDLSEGDRDAIWREVVEQVTRQGCGLGHYASAPPRLDADEMAASIEGGPTTIPG